MTENAYNSLWKDQIPLVLSLIVNRNNYDIKVNNIDIENYHKIRMEQLPILIMFT